jgi:hypothetical protein
VNVPGSGGLGFEDVRAAFVEFLKNPNLLGLDVAQYNPDKDSDGKGAKKLVDLLVEGLTARIQSLAESESPAPESSNAPADAVANAAPSTAATEIVEGPPETLNEAPSAELPADETPLNESSSSETTSDENESDEPDELSSRETSA